MEIKVDIRERASLAATWLVRSMEVTKGRGSSAFFAPWRYPLRKWAPAYPETSGYLIPTLLKASTYFPELNLNKYVFSCADWLCEVQLKDGSFPALFGKKPTPSVFNTGQIMLGFLAIMDVEQSKKYRDALQRAASWLVQAQEADGRWEQGAYKPGFIPTYYSRVAWPLIQTAILFEDPELLDAGRRALLFLKTRFHSDHSLEQSGFHAGKMAFTHTIAYALRGFYECAILLPDKPLEEQVIATLDWLFSEKESSGKLAGQYRADWVGDYSFICLTGNAQFSILLQKISKRAGDDRFHAWAKEVLQPVLQAQQLTGGPNRRGAIPGSAPLWGPYARGRFPNWAAKFFLDACLAQMEAMALRP